jgi:hypothetical protein
MAVQLMRRALLLALLPLAAHADSATLESDGRTLRWEGKPGQLRLPGGARTMAFTPINGADLSAVAVTDAASNSNTELLLLALHDGNKPRIVALELLQWAGPEGRLSTRFTADSNFTTLILDRSAAVRRTNTIWRRESWRDFLLWNKTGFLDQPVRPPMKDSLQFAMQARRAKTLEWLATPRDTLTAEDLAALGLDAAGFSLG